MKFTENLTIKEKALFYKEFSDILCNLEESIAYYEDKFDDTGCNFYLTDYVYPKQMLIDFLASLDI